MRIPGFFLIWKKVSRKKPKIGGGASKKRAIFRRGASLFGLRGGASLFGSRGGELHLPHLVHMYACHHKYKRTDVGHFYIMRLFHPKNPYLASERSQSTSCPILSIKACCHVKVHKIRNIGIVHM